MCFERKAFISVVILGFLASFSKNIPRESRKLKELSRSSLLSMMAAKEMVSLLMVLFITAHRYSPRGTSRVPEPEPPLLATIAMILSEKSCEAVPYSASRVDPLATIA